MEPKIRLSTAYPINELFSFLNSATLSFSNLDWISSRERLDAPFCYALEDEGQIKALISCQPEDANAAWLRFFVGQSDGKHADYFRLLLNRALIDLKAAGVQGLYTLSFKSWQEQLFSGSAFFPHTRIITLIRLVSGDTAFEPPAGWRLRPMTQEDLPEVEEVDHAAFSSPWQLNRASLQAAFRGCSYNTVAEQNGRIVAYQMTAASYNISHLARLAVLPNSQQHGLGSSLVQDTIREAEARGSTEISVNTQTNNASSLRLYSRFGFQQEGKLVPVFKKAVQEI